MSSRVQQREQARTERKAREREIYLRQRRRQRMWQLGALLAFAALVVVGVIVGTSSGKKHLTSPQKLSQQAVKIDQQLAGIAQNGTVLGSKSAPVELTEFGDLQCPACSLFSTNVLPAIIEKYVRTGKVRLVYVNLPFAGPDSLRAAQVALAAAQQNRMWQFIELFYANQGPENSGYVTEAFLRRLAQAIPKLDVNRVLEPASGEVVAQLNKNLDLGKQYKVANWPSFLITVNGKPPRKLPTGLGLDKIEGELNAALANK